VLTHAAGEHDTLSARLYYGTRQVFQTLAFSGAALTSAGGVVDLDRDYSGAAFNWTHTARFAGRTLRWTAGIDADRLRELRRGYVNEAGRPGALRRDELDGARNRDVYAQADWQVAADWRVLAGVRDSRVRFTVDDRFRTAASPDDSGAVDYHQTSPVLGAVWQANEDLNVYANAGRGFETPTLAESAYRAGGTGPNFALWPSVSTQLEAGLKLRRGAHTLDAALFHARSDDEITPQGSSGGRAIFQNVDGVVRRGAELSWQGRWPMLTAQAAYTLLDARFRQGFTNGAGAVPAGRRLPGAPRDSLALTLEARPLPRFTAALEMRADSRAWVDDANSDAAPGYAVAHLRAGYALHEGGTPVYLYARIDNLFDRRYAGSVIVNDANGRYFEPAPGRRLFAGVRVRWL
jgi:iron complex outermembrane receptor protein